MLSTTTNVVASVSVKSLAVIQSRAVNMDMLIEFSGSDQISQDLNCTERHKELTKHRNELCENAHTRELISARNTSHKYNNEDLSHLR